jgi:hypothetical protein
LPVMLELLSPVGAPSGVACLPGADQPALASAVPSARPQIIPRGSTTISDNGRFVRFAVLRGRWPQHGQWLHALLDA